MKHAGSFMRFILMPVFLQIAFVTPISINAQDDAISPSIIITGEYLGESAPLRDLPTLTYAERQRMAEKAKRKMLNPKLRVRSFPFENSALPKGPDPVRQKDMGANRDTRAPMQNFNGFECPGWPPDANGTMGQEYYVQTINFVYSVYDRAGNLVAGPGYISNLFRGVAGAKNNDGDPIALYDEQADRYLVAEFSVPNPGNDSMLIAVSATNDPTGTWYRYSFDVSDVPDYEKFGIWQDGYYMGTNNSGSNDIYVFERSQILTGGTAQCVGFDNPWRPTGGFMCVPPVDNDGAFAPAGEPGLFITLNDDAVGGGSDQLWIFELNVDWTTPTNSTFNRVQQLDVAAFDSNFGTSQDNIEQLGTNIKLDAIPQVIMNPPQYRNFGAYETIVCCHTVDVDNTDHAGIRWYELRRPTDGTWTIRQQGSYAPDGDSRWMGSIMLNGSNEIGLGYSVSSSTIYPGIRYCGQSAAAYAEASGNLDVAEEIIQAGVNSQTEYNRWGDYSGLQIDPADDETFWFTSQYIGSGGERKTKIANFQIGTELLTANFVAGNINPQINMTVYLTDVSYGSPTSWSWSITPGTYNYVGGTSASSQHPQVQFTAAGNYSITLTVSDGIDNDSETKTNYINAVFCDALTIPISEDFSDGIMPGCWLIVDHQGNGQVWRFNNPGERTINTSTASNGFAILDHGIYGPGNSQDADLITPVLNFSANSNVNLSFQHYYSSAAGSSGTLSYSIDGGSIWSVIQTWTAETANPSTFIQDVSAQVAGKSNVRFRWNYAGSYDTLYFWAIDDINITGTPPVQWTGSTSGDWNTAANWGNNVVPTDTTMVAISATATNWPVVTGDLTLGINCKNLTLMGGAQLTVTGNMTVKTDRTLAFIGSGELYIGGNWTNCGTFLPGTGTVKFTGSNPVTVAGYTTTSNLTNYMRSTFAKGMTELTGVTLGPQGNTASVNVALGFNFNYSGTNYTETRICTNGWMSMNKTGYSSASNHDLFTITTPNTTVTAWWDDLMDDATSVISYKTEGTAPFRVFTAEWDSVLALSLITTRISFQVKLFETTNIIEFHYGNLVEGTHSISSESASIGIEDAAATGIKRFIDGYTGLTTSGNDSLQCADVWPTLNNYRFTPLKVTQTFANVTVDKSGAFLSFNSDVVVNGNFTITNGTVAGPDAVSGSLKVGGDWSNNGTYTPGSGTVVLNGTANQNLGGSSSTTFSNLTINNPIGITLQNSAKVSDTLTMTSGNIDCSSDTLELGTSTADTGSLSWTSGNISGNFKRWIAPSTVTAIDFPVGTDADNHNARITFSNNTGGSITTRFEPGDPGNNSGFPLTEDSQSLYADDLYTEGSWTMVPATLASTNYALELTGTGFSSAGTLDGTVRILKRPDGGGVCTLNGSHVTGSAPVAKRSGLSGFSRFALAKACIIEATVDPGGPDTICRSASPDAFTLAGASSGGSASTAAWSITSLNPTNGENNGVLSSTALTANPASVTYTPPANYAGIITLTLTSDDPPGSCLAAGGTRILTVTPRRKLSGSFTYYNQANTPLISEISVKLYQDGSQVGSNYIVTSGTYQFTDLCPGTYEIRVSSSGSTDGSINTTDAAQTNYWGAIPYEIQKVRFYAGDVTGSSFFLNGTDALRIQENFVNGIVFDKGPWAFWKAGETISSNSNPSESYTKVTIAGSDVTADIYGLCAGDFNRSFTPGEKVAACTTLDLIYDGKRQISRNQEFELPIHLVDASTIGAISLILNFPTDLVEVLDVMLADAESQLDWAVKNNELRIGWNSLVPLNLAAGDELVSLRLKAKAAFTIGKSIRITLAPNPLNELADDKYNVIGDAVLSVEVIDASTIGIDEHGILNVFTLNCQPNPFSNFTMISYTLPHEGEVNLEIDDILGRKVITLINETQASGDHVVKFDTFGLPGGIYNARLKLTSTDNELIRTFKLINNK